MKAPHCVWCGLVLKLRERGDGQEEYRSQCGCEELSDERKALELLDRVRNRTLTMIAKSQHPPSLAYACALDKIKKQIRKEMHE